jgi:hypothetical protein
MPRINLSLDYLDFEDSCPYCGGSDIYFDKKGNLKCTDCDAVLSSSNEKKHKVKKFKNKTDE